MRHQKIFKREDGSQVMVSVSLTTDWARDTKDYSWYAWSRSKGKKKWISPTNSDDYNWRSLSLEERAKHNTKLYLEIAALEEVQETAEELWQSLKPNILQP